MVLPSQPSSIYCLIGVSHSLPFGLPKKSPLPYLFLYLNNKMEACIEREFGGGF